MNQPRQTRTHRTHETARMDAWTDSWMSLLTGWLGWVDCLYAQVRDRLVFQRLPRYGAEPRRGGRDDRRCPGVWHRRRRYTQHLWHQRVPRGTGAGAGQSAQQRGRIGTALFLHHRRCCCCCGLGLRQFAAVRTQARSLARLPPPWLRRLHSLTRNELTVEHATDHHRYSAPALWRMKPVCPRSASNSPDVCSSRTSKCNSGPPQSWCCE